METVSVVDYGGIFKFVRSEKSKVHFLRARVLISEDKFPEARTELLQARHVTKDSTDHAVIDLVLHELQLYLDNKLPATLQASADGCVNWTAVSKRNVKRLDEDLDRLPQGVFVVKIDTSTEGVPLVLAGRKMLSNLWLQNRIPEIFCSQVQAGMLLGLLSDWRVTDTKAVVFYKPILPEEKLAIFQKILDADAKDVDIFFPFPLIKTVTRKEFCSPPEGWDVDVNFDHSLSHGEEHIRSVTVDLLRQLGMTSHLLYDPACSTGVFLYSLKQAFPACTTVGQDLSRKMCDVASSRVDTVHCGSAIQPQIKPGTADCVFVRFLNSEVVTSQDAELLLSALLPTVKVGGVMVTFGHTPVLLSSSYFESLPGFERVANIAASKGESPSIFQYYVIRRVAAR